jgi:hypothetical protein
MLRERAACIPSRLNPPAVPSAAVVQDKYESGSIASARALHDVEIVIREPDLHWAGVCRRKPQRSETGLRDQWQFRFDKTPPLVFAILRLRAIPIKRLQHHTIIHPPSDV